jgi:eukaryotic translation initiation factor 2C
MVRCKDEQQTYVTQVASKLVDVPVQVSEQGDPYSRMEHSVEVMGDDRRIEAECGILISKHLVNVQIQTLPLPRRKDHDVECLPSVGQWNMMHRKMINGGIVKHWTCINFSRYVTVDITHQSYNELTLMCRTLGMMCGIKPVLTIQGVEPG